MPVNRWTITSREEWLQRRRENINGSEIGALLGVSPFMTPYQLHIAKAELADLPSPDSDVLERGEILEPSIALAVAKERPDWKIKKSTDYLWSSEWRLGCTPDFDVYCPKRGRGTMQGKTVAGPEYDEKWGDEVPDYVLFQTLQEGMLEEVSWMAVGVLIVRNAYKLERRVFEFERHESAEKKIIARAGEFWADVEAGRKPQPNYSLDGGAIKRVYSKGGGGSVDLTLHNQISFLCEEKLAWMKRANAADKALEVIDSEIVDVLGDAERGDHPHFNITRKSQMSGGFEVPRQKIRVLRVTRKKQPDSEQVKTQPKAQAEAA